jgi:hypothetical protein
VRQFWPTGGRIGPFEYGTLPGLVLAGALPLAVGALMETPYWRSSATEKEEQRVIAATTASFIIDVIVVLRFYHLNTCLQSISALSRYPASRLEIPEEPDRCVHTYKEPIEILLAAPTGSIQDL